MAHPRGLLLLTRAALRALPPALLIAAGASAASAAPTGAPREAAPSAASLPATDAVRTFPLSQVRLLDSPFRRAQEIDRAYLLRHDIHRLLAPFRLEAGLEPKASKYPNWESSGLDGHTAGHYLTAVAQMWAATGDAEMKNRMDAMVGELAECQRASGDGYVGGIPGGRGLWKDVAAGRINFQSFSLNGAWVPWYNEHKLFAGLRDAWLIGGNAQARDVLVRLADWCDTLLAHLSDQDMQAMLGTEHGGMNEVLADVYAITGDARYLRLAQRFSHRALLAPLLLHQDRLTGLHANTQIPKVIGFARIAELGGDASWRDAARFFWSTVVEHRSLAFGGNSEREHFNPADDFSTVVESREGPETCNTYNMLRLTEALFRHEPAARYADYYERALYNHILSSQHPEHGGFVYFTPIRPRHYRVYSQPEVCFWCCVGSGMENHGKYGEFIYAHSDDALLVNLFIASELDWKDRAVRVRQETEFPDVPHTRLIVGTKTPQRFSIRIRHPSWVAAGALALRVNGELQQVASSPSSYAELTREWRDGDRVDVDLPMRTTVERLPDGEDYVAFLHGPIVLAAKTGTESLDGLVAGDGRMAHVAPGPYLPIDQAPMLVGSPDKLAEALRPVPGKPLTFTATELIRPESFRNLELVPFFRVHDARYMMYWRTVTPEKYPEVVASLERAERERLEREARTLDNVVPGEQQPEVEHRLASEDSRSGVTVGRHWRDAGKWFSYEMKAAGADTPLELVVSYHSMERGRSWDIFVNDQRIASLKSPSQSGDRLVEVAYPLPADLVRTAPNGVLTVKFVATGGSRTASVYGVRLVKSPAP
ncbi:glycosyl hydrolase [Opitutaceae bacterium EW11]|nr:glycosyl hydrolase [Opitutaceae bacterium EW11]